MLFTFEATPTKMRTLILVKDDKAFASKKYSRHINRLTRFDDQPVKESLSSQFGHITFISIDTHKTPSDWLDIGLKAGSRIRGQKTTDWQCLLYTCNDQQISQFCCGLAHALCKFDTYKTDNTDSKTHIKIICDQPSRTQKAFEHMHHLIEGQNWTKDLVNRPSNDLTPERFADEARDVLTQSGCEIRVYDAKEMIEKGMHAFVGVGKGSANQPRYLTALWQGNPNDKNIYALVGKGVTFDTGGISLKPALNMHKMKYDMTGAATVLGTLLAISKNKLPINIIVGVGLAENMPGSNAQKPGDIVTTLSGKTVEVQNTDAEGRMILCDVLYDIVDRYKPSAIIDCATLTGAVIVALGHCYAGLFSNDKQLTKELKDIGISTGEELWHMPLHPAYAYDLKSSIADLNHIGYNGAGSCTAAQFLSHFVKETPWAHIDMAGTAWIEQGKTLKPHGPSGYGVQLLYQWAHNRSLDAK